MIWLIVILLGVIQGITEWLPVSSTGHMLLFEGLFPMNVTSEFRGLFMVVIQFGSIIAVLVLFWRRLWPFGRAKAPEEKKAIWTLWGKVLVAAVPAAIIGLLLDNFIEDYIYSDKKLIVKCSVIAGALIVYGVAFIVIERCLAGRENRVETVDQLSYRDAIIIGCFQTLALIPGTSRSGATIVGARLCRISRTAAAEFSFFLAIPVMLGASALKIGKYFLIDKLTMSGAEVGLLLVGGAVAFLVSLVVIRFLMDFVRRHSFEPFGWYRIGLGAAVLLYMFLRYVR